MAQIINDPNGGINSGGKPFDWVKASSQTNTGVAPPKPFDWGNIKNILNNQGFPDTSNVTSTPVLCKDGTTKNQLSSPIGKYADACVNNGGRAVNQPVVNAPVKGKEDTTKKLLGAYNKNLIIAVFLVAGYFAYKKFKK